MEGGCAETQPPFLNHGPCSTFLLKQNQPYFEEVYTQTNGTVINASHLAALLCVLNEQGNIRAGAFSVPETLTSLGNTN